MSKNGKLIYECHYDCYVMISTSSPCLFRVQTGFVLLNSHFTATPDNIAETNMAMHNASVTQNGPISVTIRPSAQKQVLLFFNHLLLC